MIADPETAAAVLGRIDGPRRDEVAASIAEFLQMLPWLVCRTSMVERFLERSSRFAEHLHSIVLAACAAAGRSGPHLSSRRNLPDPSGELVEVVESPALGRPLDSCVLSNAALDVMDRLCGSVIEARAIAIGPPERLDRLSTFRTRGARRGRADAMEIARA